MSSAAVTLAAYTDSACTVAATGALSVSVNPQSAISGVASFSGVAYAGLGGSIYLKASAMGVTSACSSAISVTAGTATQLVFSTLPPSSANSGITFSTQPVVQVKDVSGNLVTTATNSITLGAYVDFGCSTVASATFGAAVNPLAASGGTAAFSGVMYTGDCPDNLHQSFGNGPDFGMFFGGSRRSRRSFEAGFTSSRL